MKILFYGDSLTFGYKAPFGRKEAKNRWTNMIVKNNPESQIKVNGVCGRSLVAKRPERIETEFDGRFDILIELADKSDYDKVVIFLGTNDLIHGQLETTEELSEHIKLFKDSVNNFKKENNAKFELIFVIPPKFGNIIQDEFQICFKGDMTKAFKENTNNTVDLSKFITADDFNEKDADGVHMSIDNEVTIFREIQSNIFN